MDRYTSPRSHLLGLYCENHPDRIAFDPMPKTNFNIWWLISLFGLSGLFGLTFLAHFGESCVTAGYERRSLFPFVNEFFSSKSPNLQSHFQRLVKAQIQLLSVLWVCFGIAFILVQQKEFQRWFDRRWGKPRGNTSWRKFTPFRRAIVLVSICGLVGMSLLSMLTGKEAWPFSPYFMFSNSRISFVPLEVYRLYIVKDDQETRLTVSNFGHERMTRITPVLANWHSQKDSSRIQAALNGWLTLCQKKQAEDPPTSLRLYLESWDHLDPLARDTNSPDKRYLIFESSSKSIKATP